MSIYAERSKPRDQQSHKPKEEGYFSVLTSEDDEKQQVMSKDPISVPPPQRLAKSSQPKSQHSKQQVKSKESDEAAVLRQFLVTKGVPHMYVDMFISQSFNVDAPASASTVAFISQLVTEMHLSDLDLRFLMTLVYEGSTVSDVISAPIEKEITLEEAFIQWLADSTRHQKFLSTKDVNLDVSRRAGRLVLNTDISVVKSKVLNEISKQFDAVLATGQITKDACDNLLSTFLSFDLSTFKPVQKDVALKLVDTLYSEETKRPKPLIPQGVAWADLVERDEREKQQVPIVKPPPPLFFGVDTKDLTLQFIRDGFVAYTKLDKGSVYFTLKDEKKIVIKFNCERQPNHFEFTYCVVAHDEHTGTFDHLKLGLQPMVIKADRHYISVQVMRIATYDFKPNLD
jgi:hypothetical protein